MNFNEFLTHAKKVNGMPLDTLAKEVGAHMVLYPESGMKVIEKALKPFESPEVIRWDLLSICLNKGDALDMAVVIATSPCSMVLTLMTSSGSILTLKNTGTRMAVTRSPRVTGCTW